MRAIRATSPILATLLLVSLPATAQEGGRRRDREAAPIVDHGPRTALADAVRMPSGLGAVASGTGGVTRSDDRRLQELAAQTLLSPPPAAREVRADVRELLRSIEALKRVVAASESSPVSVDLSSLREQRLSVERAFDPLGARLRSEGRSALAGELGDRFESIWRDVDQALTATPARRRELLGAVRMALEAAHPTSDRHHDVDVTVLPTDEMP